MGKIKAICISEKRGIQKTKVSKAILRNDFGIVGDAHAGDWHRQISFLPYEDIKNFKEKGAQIKDGDFGENIITEGIDFSILPIGSLLQCNEVIFKLTQRGKECHTHCAIYHKMGECIMPTKGVFAEVKKSGEIKEGDEIIVLDSNKPIKIQVGIITCSDSSFLGQRKDLSGPKIKEILQKEEYEIKEMVIIPDEMDTIKKTLLRLVDQRELDLIITTGGTGCTERDVTPEATLEVINKNVPGISEAIRLASLSITPHAMLSRGVSGIRKNTLIINLPGSPKAVKESMDVILPCLPHAIGLLRGTINNCANTKKD